MKLFLHLAFTVLFPSIALAQSTITGSVSDTALRRPMAFATLSLVQAKDSSLVTFSRADSSGRFVLKSIPKGRYRLSASYVGYNPVWIDVTIKEGDNIVNMGDIILTDLKRLGEVTVITKRPPVTVNNDTLEFNTENFATQPNAVVEELLKKMPGVTIDNDGTVRVNGQKIKRILVNGKEFFTGDPKMATKNLPADAVDKVQVFDKKSDRAEFTGIDDGNSEKTINLKLKKDRNNALFGKVTAGVGTKNRYDGQFNLNKFKGEQQVSVLGMANNTNRQGFSFTDALAFSGDMMRNMRGGGGIVIRTDGGDNDDNGLPVAGAGNNKQGVAKTYAGGINYNDKWGKNTDVNASYIISDQSLQTTKEISRQNTVSGNNFSNLQNSNTNKENVQHRVNFSIDTRIDSFNSIKISPSLTWQKSKTNSRNTYSATKANGRNLNSGYTNSISDAEGINFKNNMLYRKRFAKKGRTVSANINMGYNESTGNSSLNSNNMFYDTATGTVVFDSLLNQQIGQDAINRNAGATLTYTEPLGKRSLAELGYFYNYISGVSGKKTYDFNSGSGKHDMLNQLLSNDFTSNFIYSGGSINIRSEKPKWSYTYGASLQQSSLNSKIYNSPNISQKFTDLLPNANINYRPNGFKNIRLDYTTNVRMPSVTQLQPVADVSDPLNIRDGNPALKREFVHNLNLNYFSADPATRKNFFAFVSLSTTKNAIVYSDFLDVRTGVRRSTPVNVNGVYQAFSSFNAGFPIRKLNSRMEIGSSLIFSKNASIINNNPNNITNLSINPNVSWSFGIDNKIDLQATAKVGYNEAKYSFQKQLNSNYWLQQYVLDMTNYLPLGFMVYNNFSYLKTTGRATGFNTTIPIWNASVAKGFLKNKRGEVKVSVFDLLNKNIGITRNANQNYIEDIRYNVLNRYFLFSFTYSLNKSGLNSGPKVFRREL